MKSKCGITKHVFEDKRSEKIIAAKLCVYRVDVFRAVEGLGDLKINRAYLRLALDKQISGDFFDFADVAETEEGIC